VVHIPSQCRCLWKTPVAGRAVSHEEGPTVYSGRYRIACKIEDYFEGDTQIVDNEPSESTWGGLSSRTNHGELISVDSKAEDKMASKEPLITQSLETITSIRDWQHKCGNALTV
jgi:hypothetical protein